MSTISTAALLTSIGGKYEISEIELGDPVGREVLLEVNASGLCRSDHSLAVNDLGIPLPRLLGHEVAGVVLAAGPDVTDLAVGDHVVSGVAASCGSCLECRAGHAHLCLRAGFTGRPAGLPPRITFEGKPVWQGLGIGGFARHALIHEAQLVRVQAEVPFDRAALLGCGVVTGVGAVTRSAQVAAGEDVAVIGVGGVGLNVIQGARLAGARTIIAVDLQDDKLELARSFGATHTVNSSAVDAVETVVGITSGLGAKHVFEAIGAVPTVQQGLGMLARGGTVYLIGLQKPGTVLEWQIGMMTSRTFSWEHGIRGVNMGSADFKREVPYLADLYLQDRINLDDLVSSRIPIHEINDGYAAMLGGRVARAVLTDLAG